MSDEDNKQETPRLMTIDEVMAILMGDGAPTVEDMKAKMHAKSKETDALCGCGTCGDLMKSVERELIRHVKGNDCDKWIQTFAPTLALYCACVDVAIDISNGKLPDEAYQNAHTYMERCSLRANAIMDVNHERAATFIKDEIFPILLEKKNARK